MIDAWRVHRWRGISPYSEARSDHAELLREEGLTLQAIGYRLGCTGCRVDQMIRKRQRRPYNAARYHVQLR